MLCDHTAVEIDEYLRLITDHPVSLLIGVELVAIHTEVKLVRLILEKFF